MRTVAPPLFGHLLFLRLRPVVNGTTSTQRLLGESPPQNAANPPAPPSAVIAFLPRARPAVMQDPPRVRPCEGRRAARLALRQNGVT